MRLLTITCITLTIGVLISCSQKNYPTYSGDRLAKGSVVCIITMEQRDALARQRDVSKITYQNLVLLLTSEKGDTISPVTIPITKDNWPMVTHEFDKLPESVEWTLNVESYDQNNALIQSVNKTFSLQPYDTIHVNLVINGKNLDEQSETNGLKKLENPYSITNMKRARNKLVVQGELKPGEVTDKDLLPTHRYVKINPTDEKQYNALLKNPSLDLWEYPLDCVIPKDYLQTVDTGENGTPVSLWGAVPIEVSLDGLNYRIIDEVILDPPDDAQSRGECTISEDVYEMLEHEAFRNTGNIPNSEKGIVKRSGRYRPSGRIQVYDQVLRTRVPIAGVKVRTRCFMKTWRGYTRNDGSFTCGRKYKYSVHYSLEWEYNHCRFDIRSGRTGQARVNGPESRRPWNFTIRRGTLTAFYAHIFRAGSFYLRQEPFRLDDRPFDLISIQAMNENSPDIRGRYRGSNENIRIWRYDSDGSLRKSALIFSITSHELAHAHHDEIYEGRFNTDLRDATRLKETWASAIQYFFTMSVFPQTNANGRQNWRPGGGGNYTPFMIDLIDAHNQNSENSENLNDDISGYTLRQFEEIIKNEKCTSLRWFADRVWKLRVPSGNTRTQLNNYFAYYGFERVSARLYNLPNCRGRCLVTFDNIPNLEDLPYHEGGTWSNRISSIRLFHGALIRCFGHTNYRGGSIYLGRHGTRIPDLATRRLTNGSSADNTISSVQLIRP